jgi:hypothetical protein
MLNVNLVEISEMIDQALSWYDEESTEGGGLTKEEHKLSNRLMIIKGKDLNDSDNRMEAIKLLRRADGIKDELRRKLFPPISVL